MMAAGESCGLSRVLIKSKPAFRPAQRLVWPSTRRPDTFSVAIFLPFSFILVKEKRVFASLLKVTRANWSCSPSEPMMDLSECLTISRTQRPSTSSTPAWFWAFASASIE
eukprot:Lithocolla_globosa_v1_NODE_3305_length_1705_cov_26.426061.p2 type:complete len:110 gc:universal NODE_3305_length_1705_cov_26.426061:1158-1487(+)